MKWWRAYHGMPVDPRWMVIARRAGGECTPGHVVAVWAAMLDRASQSSERGSVVGFDHESIAAFYGWEESLVLGIVEALEEKGLTKGGRVVKWDEKQPDTEDKTRAERQRRWRERQKQKAGEKAAHGADDVTDSNALRDVTVTDNAPKRRGDTCISEPLSQDSNPSLKSDTSRTVRAQALAFGDVVDELDAQGIPANFGARLPHRGKILNWIKQGLTQEQLLEAVMRARKKRQAQQDHRPVNIGFLECFVSDVLEGKGESNKTRSNDHGDNLGREFVAGR